MPHYRSHFPIFERRQGLAYLDSAATAQKPQAVINAVFTHYVEHTANVHRGLYGLSQESTAAYEASRAAVASFIGANSEREIIFTKGATDSLNALASSLSASWKPGDNIVISLLEHHSNFLPWQAAAKTAGVELRIANLTDGGDIDLDNLAALIDGKTKAISLSHCSNVLGRFTPFPAIKKIITEQGSETVLIADACQSVPHIPLSVQELGVDFLAFSGHKLYGPSGIGVLWGREALLAALPPYQTGGEMVKTASLEGAVWNDLPWKFEAGTPNIEGAIGLGAAIGFLEEIGMQAIAGHTASLAAYARKELEAVPELAVIGNPDPKSGIISFTVSGIHPHDLAEILAEREICIRAGHHCAAPLHSHLNLQASNRISIGMYTIQAEIDACVIAIKEAIKLFNHV